MVRTPKIIAITGPESTGKSSLAEGLATHYGTLWVEEYARTYLRELGRSYAYDDILEIARRQHAAVLRALSACREPYLFLDTEFTVLRIWCEFKYGRCHQWIREMEQEQPIDLFLLTDIDLPWQPDPLREHPEKRQELFNLYHMALRSRSVPLYVVRGRGDERLLEAVRVIDQRFQNI
jgi:NadR type nicotinamide-nucleotide adenylyltransferase